MHSKKTKSPAYFFCIGTNTQDKKRKSPKALTEQLKIVPNIEKMSDYSYPLLRYGA